MGKSLQNGTLFDSMKLREKRNEQVSVFGFCMNLGSEKKRKKDFAKDLKRCTLVSLDRVRSSSLNLLSSETPKSISLGLRTQSIL